MREALPEIFPGEEHSPAVWPRFPFFVEVRMLVVTTDGVARYVAFAFPYISTPLTLVQLVKLAAYFQVWAWRSLGEWDTRNHCSLCLTV